MKYPMFSAVRDDVADFSSIVSLGLVFRDKLASDSI